MFYQIGRIINLILIDIEPLEDRSERQAELAKAAANKGSLEDDDKYDKPSLNTTLAQFPQLKNFTSYGGAYEEINKRMPQNFFMGFASLTIGEKVAGGITLIAGLAIALVLEL